MYSIVFRARFCWDACSYTAEFVLFACFAGTFGHGQLHISLRMLPGVSLVESTDIYSHTWRGSVPGAPAEKNQAMTSARLGNEGAACEEMGSGAAGEGWVGSGCRTRDRRLR